MSNEYTRNLRDAALTVVKALPAAAASNNSPTLDLGQPIGGILENIQFELSIPALPSLVDAKTVTFKVQDSADDSSYADIDPLISTTVVGAGGAGAAAKVVRFRLPPNARRYIQINQAVLTGGGDNTAKSTTFSALF